MITDLNGFWERQHDKRVFEIKETETEYFSVVEKDTNKQYDFHLSLGSPLGNDGHLTSKDPSWDSKRIHGMDEDTFYITHQFSNEPWIFKRKHYEEAN
ncbi:MAG TPA: hypothetical protein PLD52_02135 [Bacteroidales bacterium]|nr:hypothetical protein [Bacteroidales bacterium]